MKYMDKNDWRERFSVSDAEIERLCKKVEEISKSHYEDAGEPIDCVIVTFHFTTVLRRLEVSVDGSEPFEISDDAEIFEKR